ncbi:MAG: TonB-dependent receptor [Bacteroidota bacterium]
MKPFLLLFLFSIPIFSTAQKDTTLLEGDLVTFTIQADRIQPSSLRQPYAVSTYKATELQETRQQLSLQEYVSHIPGLFSLNANNYAQDLRISMRGFGARSAFGIRGIKLIVDGIPETTPDGQGQVDNLNLGIIERVEVLKGSASALYGNASGGVINIQTISLIDSNFLSFRPTIGAFGLQQYQLKGGLANEKQQLIGHIAHTRTDGYRVQSGLQSTNLNLRFRQQLNKNANLRLQFNFVDSPIADDPGSLNLEAVETDRRQARDRNVLFQTGEAIQHWKTGATYQTILRKYAIKSYGFFAQRNFEGRLPFENGGWIDLNRNYFGQGLNVERFGLFRGAEYYIHLGYDWAVQRDDRQRFRNLEGTRGEVTLDQLEQFSNLGLYALGDWEWNNWHINLGLRYDWNWIGVDENIGDRDENINLTAFNPSIGINYYWFNNWSVFGSYRSSFETPTLSELSANPTNEGGFNENLDAQEADNFELGVKYQGRAGLGFELTAFRVLTTNDLVPFELADFPDRTFFRNAGETVRNGVEANMSYIFSPKWQASLSYTLSDFRYVAYNLPNADFSGRELPGIPKHLASFLLTHQAKDGLLLRTQLRYLGDFFAEDANQVQIDDTWIADLSLAYPFSLPALRLQPFIGINNLFDVRYFDNVRINAFGNRYYEPAAGLNIYGGIKFQLH